MKVLCTQITIIVFLLVASTAYAQTNIADESSQYVFKDFSRGEVLLKDNKKQSTIMNYNAVTEKIVFEQNGQRLDLTNLNTIDTVYLQNSKFVPVDDVFYEVIESTHIPLFIQHKRKLVPPKKRVGYGQTSDLASTHSFSSIEMHGERFNLPLPEDYKARLAPTFWVLKDDEMKSFSSERQLLRIFPKKKREIKAYIKKEKLKLENKKDLVKIITFCAKENE